MVRVRTHPTKTHHMKRDRNPSHGTYGKSVSTNLEKVPKAGIMESKQGDI